MVGHWKRRWVWTIVLGGLALLTSLIGCGGGGGGDEQQSQQPQASTVLITGRAHAGTPARPLALAPCRLVARSDGQQLDQTVTDAVGAFDLRAPLGQESLIVCHPAALPNLELAAFISTVGLLEGARLPDEDVTPASSVMANIILANDPLNPQVRKEELQEALARAETDIATLVEAATLLYQTLFEAQIESDVSFTETSGESDDGGGDADGGGVEGEAGDGGEFSPLPGALCSFSLDAAGLARSHTLMFDLFADGAIDQDGFPTVAATVNSAMDVERRRAISQAFAALFPLGVGPLLATIADGPESGTPGRYVLPTPIGIPGVITCIPDNLDHLILRACAPARAREEVLIANDVTPVSTLVCEIANEAKQSGAVADRETIASDLRARLAPLRIFLPEDRNANGIQDADERDKNGDGVFDLITKLDAVEPLTDDNRDAALLATMSTAIFDGLRTTPNLPPNASFDEARNDFFDNAEFADPLKPLASGVDSALSDPDNQAVLGAADVVSAARTGVLEGRVLDARGRPVSDVEVRVWRDDIEVSGPDLPAITDVDGRFQIRDIPVGDVTVKAFLDEFEILSMATTVVAVVNITLEIEPVPILELRPDALVYGEVEVQAERVLTVRLRNVGSAELTIDRLQIEGAAAFRFRRPPAAPVIVSAGSEVSVDIGYTPTAVGVDRATLRVESDAQQGAVVTVPLIGEAAPMPAPQMELSHTALDFGDVQLGDSRTQAIVVRNSGTAPLTVSAVTIPSDAGFQLQQAPALPVVLPNDGEFELLLSFAPPRRGRLRGVMRLHSDAPREPILAVALRGVGVEAPMPEIAAEPSVIEFGQAQINASDADALPITRTLELRNIGAADLIVTAIRVNSARGREFEIPRLPSFPLTIIPGAVLPLEVHYTPTLLGSVTGAARVRSNATNVDNDLRIALNGIGVDQRAPKLDLSATVLDFGDVDVGAARRLSLDVTNLGNGELEIRRLALQSAGQVYQLLRPPGTPFTLPPGGARSLTAQFQPDKARYETATLRIDSNEADQPRHRVSLRGQGVLAPMPKMVVSPTAVAFGDVQVGATSSIEVKVSNPGMAPLQITDVEGTVLLAKEFKLRQTLPLPVTVQPNAEWAFDVLFQPQQVGSSTGTLRLRGSAADTPVLTVPLHGVATPQPLPKMKVSSQTLDFGETQVGASKTQRVDIKNEGSADLDISDLRLTAQSSGDFRIVKAPQTPVAVVPGSEVRVRIRHTPSAPGAASGVLRWRSSDPAQPVTRVSLNGMGKPEPAPQIDVSPLALAFGQVQTNSSQTVTFTVGNPGTATLILTALTLDSQVFHVPNAKDLPIPIPPQGMAQIAVSYQPTAAGADTGVLSIEHNSPAASAVMLTLSGSAIPEPKPRVDAVSLAVDFDRVQIGSSREMEIRMSNTGAAPLDVMDVSIDGGPDDAFILTENPAPVAVVEGAGFSAKVLFTPPRPGAFSGALTVMSNAENTPTLSISLSGEGLPLPAPQIDVTPSILSFPDVLLNTQRIKQATIRNVGEANLTVTGLTITGNDASAFQVLPTLSLPVALPQDGAWTIPVAYTPTVEGSASATLLIDSDDPDNPQVVLSLNGVGAPAPAPQASASPPALSFAQVEVGQRQESQISILNGGDAPLTIHSIDVAAQDTGAFSLPGIVAQGGVLTPAIVVPPGASTSFVVAFHPTVTGTVTATLHIGTDAANAPDLMVAMDGVGAQGPTPILVVDATSLDFGSVELGQTRTLSLQVSQMGTGDLTIDTLALTAADGTSFQLGATPSLPTVMQPNATFSLDIHFTPTQVGSATGVLRIGSSNSATPEVVLSVTGEGIPATTTQVAATPPLMDFGVVQAGARTTLPLTIANVGSVDLTVSGLTVARDAGNAFQLGSNQQTSFTVAVGKTATVNVEFSPPTAGNFTAELTLQGNTPTVVVPLSGSGAVPQIAVTPTTVDFGGVILGQSQKAVVTVANTGAVPLNLLSVSATSPAFSLSNAPTNGLTLNPNESATLEVVFAPQALGNARGELQIDNDSPTSPVQVALSGRGMPTIVAGPQDLAFGDVRVGENAALNFTIRNPRDVLLPVTVALLPTAGAGGFTLENAPQQVAASGQAVGTVRFTPSVVGAQSATVRITSNAIPNQIDLQATGVGLGTPAVTITPLTIDFGNVLVGTSDSANVQIANTGSATLNVNAPVMRGDTAAFTFAGGAAAAFALQPGENAALVINFAPQQMGDAQADVDISSDAVNAPQLTASLSGAGVAPVIDTPPSLDFNLQEIGQSQTLSISVANTGTAPLNLTGFSSNEPSFVVGNASTSVAPGDVGAVDVIFTPNRLGVITADLLIDNDSINTPQALVSLTGEGGAPSGARLSATPLTLAFGDVGLNTSASLTVTVNSMGTAPVTLSGLVLGGAGGFALGMSPSTPVVLAPGDSSDIEVVFTPDALTSFSDHLEIQSDDANDPVINIVLNGVGVDITTAPNGQP